MMKRMRMFLLLFIVLFMFSGCQITEETVEPTEEVIETTEETPITFDNTTLDGTYHLIKSVSRQVNNVLHEKKEEPFTSYEVTISGNQMTESYTLGLQSVSNTYNILIKDNSFTIDGDDRNFYFNIEKGLLEIVFPSGGTPFFYMAVLGKDVNIDYNLKTYSDYYMLEEVQGILFEGTFPNLYTVHLNHKTYHEFTLDFTVEDQVTVTISPKDKPAETLFGTYIGTESMLLLIFDDREMLFYIDDEGYLVYSEEGVLFPTASQFKIRFSHQTDKQNPEYTIYPHRNDDYSNSTSLKDELAVKLDERSLLFNENYSITEFYVKSSSVVGYGYGVYGDDMIILNRQQAIWLKNYQTSDIGLIINDDFVMGTHVYAPYPIYDVSSHLTYDYQLTKRDTDHYIIKVSPNAFYQNPFLFVHLDELMYKKSELIGDLYIEVLLLDDMIQYNLNNELMETLATLQFRYEDILKFDQELNDIKQDIATEIEAAIIPMKLGVTYRLFNDMIPYYNYYFVELEPGDYEIVYTNHQVDLEFVYADGTPYKPYLHRHDSDYTRFAFEINESKTFYIKARHDTYYPGYEITLNKLDTIQETKLDITYGETYTLETSSIFDYYVIELTETNPQAYHIVYIPDDPTKSAINAGNIGYYPDKQILDVYYAVDANETLRIEIRHPGTIMIELAEDDSYGATSSHSYNLNEVTDEVFAASTFFEDDVFHYHHEQGAFIVEATSPVYLVIKNSFGVVQEMPITTPGDYYITVSIPYDNYYTEYQLVVYQSLTETVIITEDHFVHQGYYLSGIPQTFAIELAEPQVIELITDHDYGLKIIDDSGKVILDNIEKAAFTLTAGSYQIVFDYYKDSSFNLEYNNLGSSEKPPINQAISSLPIDMNLTFDLPHEIFMFTFDLASNEFIKVSGAALFYRYSYGYLDNELVEGINYGFGEDIIQVVVTKDSESTTNIQFTHRFN